MRKEWEILFVDFLSLFSSCSAPSSKQMMFCKSWCSPQWMQFKIAEPAWKIRNGAKVKSSKIYVFGTSWLCWLILVKFKLHNCFCWCWYSLMLDLMAAETAMVLDRQGSEKHSIREYFLGRVFWTIQNMLTIERLATFFKFLFRFKYLSVNMIVFQDWRY